MTYFLLDLGALLALGALAYGVVTLERARENRSPLGTALSSIMGKDLTPLGREYYRRAVVYLGFGSILTIVLGLAFWAIHGS